MTEISIICSGYDEDNIHKQPWRYFKEVAEYLSSFGYSVVIYTDKYCDLPENTKYDVVTVDKIFSKFGLYPTLESKINKSSDVVLINMTPSTFCRVNIPKNIECPTLAVLTSSIYTFQDIKQIDNSEYKRNWGYIYRQLIESITPQNLMSKTYHKFDAIVTLSEHNYKQIVKYYDITNVEHIPPGISSCDLELPQKHPENHMDCEKPTIVYFTSPLTLRGTDTLAHAFCNVRETIDAELVILSRPDNQKVVDEEEIIRGIIDDNGYSDDLTLLSEFLQPEEIKQYLYHADIVCLPYKIVLSDIPISLYEAQAMGTPVISTNVTCIPETVSEGGIVVPPSNVSELSNSLLELFNNDDLRCSLGMDGRQAMLEHPTWREIGEKMEEFINEQIND